MKGLKLSLPKLKLSLPKWKKPGPIKNKWLIPGIIGAVLLVLLLAAILVSNSILTIPTVYSGVYIDGVPMGGKTQDEVMTSLKDRYQPLMSRMSFTLFDDAYEKTFTLTELGITLDMEGMQKKAFEAGRTGPFTSRLMEISRLRKYPLTIPLEFRYDQDKLDTILEDINRLCSKEVTVPKVVIEGDTVVLQTGLSGLQVDKDALRSKMIGSLHLFQSEYIHIPTQEIKPPPIDVEAVYQAILQDPADAVLIKTKEGKAQIQPHVNGRTIDKVKLKEIIDNVQAREHQVLEEIQLPVVLIPPKVKTTDLSSLLYRDTLAYYATAFSTHNENTRNRGVNIRLAAAAIDGTVLFPGEEFSFNDVVGPRTPEKGYVIAHIYSDGEVRDGYGGGICQVSTTLYDAVLLANLAVTERHNHVFTVSYVPLGLDAAVSYGYADLKFKNNTNYPLCINARVSENNTLAFSILGTNLYPDVSVKLIPKILSTQKVTTVYVDDPNMAPGSSVVLENGMDGATVETYIKIYSGKTVINEYLLHKSTYQMLPRKIKRGLQGH